MAVTVTSNTTWRVTTSDSWLHAGTLSGSNNGAITFTADANTTNTTRTATATISATVGTTPVTRTITFTQVGLTPTLTVSPTSFPNIKSVGENVSVSVISNVSWNVTVNATWVHTNNISGNGNASVSFTVDANSANTSRTATATITTTEPGIAPITKTITFTQQAKVYTDYIEVGGVKWARANLYNGQIASSPSASSNVWNSGYFYNWNSNNPYDYTTTYTTWSDQRDPCPSGWRTPTKFEIDNLLGTRHAFGSYNGVAGVYCNTNVVPSEQERDDYLFYQQRL